MRLASQAASAVSRPRITACASTRDPEMATRSWKAASSKRSARPRARAGRQGRPRPAARAGRRSRHTAARQGFGGPVQQRVPGGGLAGGQCGRAIGPVAQEIGLAIGGKHVHHLGLLEGQLVDGGIGRRVQGIVAGSTLPVCASHSAAMACASASVGTTSGVLAGVFTGRPSSRTVKPPSQGSAVACVQNRFAAQPPDISGSPRTGRRARRLPSSPAPSRCGPCGRAGGP